VAWQSLLGGLPLFALINKFSPILTDGGGGDLLPTLLPAPLAAHYNLFLAMLLGGLAASEGLRRRFQARHKLDLSL
jgi:hypothetical protein